MTSGPVDLPPPRRWARAAAACTLAIGLGTACGNERDTTVDDTSSSPASTTSYDVAVAQAQAHASETLAAVVGGSATLADLGFGANPVVTFCADRTDPPRGTAVRATYSYRVEGADPGRAGAYFAAFEQHLAGAGWTKAHGGAGTHAVAMTRADYTVLLQLAPGNGLLSITTSTPCVAPKDPADPLAT